MIKISFLGDIVGRPGRSAVKEYLGSFTESRSHLIIANAENSAGGNGLTAKLANELRGYGCDLLTLGDHVWDQKGFEREIGNLDFVCRPWNLPTENPGRRHLEFQIGGTDVRVAVATFLGRSFMGIKADCPFLAVNDFINEVKPRCQIIFVEIHAEATAEKIAFGWHVNGKVAAVVGTHTHVQTADGEILDGGTAYLTDVGMCGPHRSVLGREVAPIVERFIDGMPRKCDIANEDLRVSCCHLDVDPNTGQCISIHVEQKKL
jgi:metallophosphoesterase (TIGR00282 family)